MYIQKKEYRKFGKTQILWKFGPNGATNMALLHSEVKCLLNVSLHSSVSDGLMTKSPPPERRKKDKLATTRSTFETMNRSLRKDYTPGIYLKVSEQLIPFHGPCLFLIYIPSKPDKYGVKIFWLTHS